MTARFLTHATALVAAAALAGPAVAASETFDLAWSGAALGNGATATGQITIDTAAFDGAYNEITLPDARVTNLNVTVSGASAGNGTFGLADFSLVLAWAPGPLDFSHQLVGQSMPDGGTWGTPNGSDGDFNLIGNDATAPVGTSYFLMTTDDRNGDTMLLTSMTPAVPEPASIALLLAGLGFVGIGARRRRTMA